MGRFSDLGPGDTQIVIEQRVMGITVACYALETGLAIPPGPAPELTWLDELEIPEASFNEADGFSILLAYEAGECIVIKFRHESADRHSIVITRGAAKSLIKQLKAILRKGGP